MIDATHFVLDLETLSTAPNAAIVAIGCVRVEHGKVIDEFYERVDLESARAQGGQVDTPTLQWWLTQPNEARREISGELPAVHITAALAGLRAFMLHGGLTEARPLVWGNGSSFDNVIVRSAFERAGIPEPWRFWSDRDLRTLLALRGLTKRSVLFEGIEHHALHDARHEARLLIQALWPQQDEPAPAQNELWPNEIHQIAFEEGQPAENGDGYLFSAEEFDLFVERLLARATRPAQTEQQPVAVPEGWKLVPIKPDIEMVEAGYEASLGQPDRSGHARAIEMYEAMLNAAPIAQTAPQLEQSGLVKMIDAAMIEMRNIAPPLRRSECERLIRAALSAQGAAA